MTSEDDGPEAPLFFDDSIAELATTPYLMVEPPERADK